MRNIDCPVIKSIVNITHRPGEIKTKTDFTGQAESQRTQRREIYFTLDRINRTKTISRRARRVHRERSWFSHRHTQTDTDTSNFSSIDRFRSYFAKHIDRWKPSSLREINLTCKRITLFSFLFSSPQSSSSCARQDSNTIFLVTIYYMKIIETDYKKVSQCTVSRNVWVSLRRSVVKLRISSG